MSKSVRISIKERDLRRLVSQEIGRLHEDVDPEGVKNVVNAASKLLKAAKDFKEKANVTMTNATTPDLDSLIQALVGMIENPSTYVDRKVISPKRVQLRRVEDEA